MPDLTSVQLASLEFTATRQGERVTIPNLYDLFPEWKPKLHKQYTQARDEFLDPWIRRYVIDDKLCEKMQKADFCIFAAILCCDASFEKLCTVAKYFAWYFIWDDLFDCGPLSNNRPHMEAYRKASVLYFEHKLGASAEYPDLSQFPVGMANALRSWDEVGTKIRRDCTTEVCEILLEEMISYLESVDSLNSIYATNGSGRPVKVPSLSEYWNRRERNAGVHCVLATVPYICNINMSKSDITEDFKALWVHASHVVHISNDMFSMRKELNDGQIENLVCLLMMRNKLSATDAMEACAKLCHKEALGFLEAEIRAKSNCPLPRETIETLITSYMNVAMGLIHWSYNGERYFSKTEIDNSYIVRFQL